MQAMMLHVHENLILDFYREKHNLSLNFFPPIPPALEIHLLILEGMYGNVSNSRKKNENWQ